jgi:hypothetical protein
MLALGLVMLGTPALETILTHALSMPFHFTEPRYIPKACVAFAARFAFVLGVLRYGAWMRIRPLFAHWPTLKQALPWLLIMAILTLPLFYSRLYSGHRLDSLRFWMMAGVEVAQFGVMLPFLEELTYRGLAFNLFLRRGRLCAYIASTTLFTLSHFIPVEDYIRSAPPFLNVFRVVLLVSFGLLSARALEVTRKLATCLLMHSCANLLPRVGLLLGAAWRTFG